MNIEKVLENWKQVKSELEAKNELTDETYVELVNQLKKWSDDKNTLNDEQTKQLAAFMWSCPTETLLICWGVIQNNTKNIYKLHPFVSKLIVAAATGADIEKIKPEEYK